MAASKRIKILTKEEAQLGKAKVFIRQPESTYMCIGIIYAVYYADDTM